ncbi:MAG: helix-turn-helix domain-containing protein [Victivallales bacterium]|nr:helix-turn-helix domain-containing protein [Victivallales bacterium]
MIQSLSRAFEILRLVSASPDGLRLYELADRMGLQRTTVHNLAGSMIKENMLAKADGSRYILGGGIEELYMAQEQRAGRLHLESALLELQRKHPEASLIYSELRGGDIFGTIHIPSGTDSEIQYPSNMELNPYWTVCGMVFLAFLPHDAAQQIYQKHPFEYKGIEAWKNRDALDAALEQLKVSGVAESPVTPADTLKLGIPVWNRRNSLSGAITFTVLRDKNNSDNIREFILKDISTTVDKIKSGV